MGSALTSSGSTHEGNAAVNNTTLSFVLTYTEKTCAINKQIEYRIVSVVTPNGDDVTRRFLDLCVMHELPLVREGNIASAVRRLGIYI